EREARETTSTATTDDADEVQISDFVAYMVMHAYIFRPTRELWPARSVNARLDPIQVGDKSVPASAWLDMRAAVEQMAWSPGEPELIRDRLLINGGWIERRGCTTYNLYRAPTIERRPGSVQPWLDHVRRIYPDDADHIVAWLAHRVQ